MTTRRSVLAFVRRLVGALGVSSWRSRQRATWDRAWWAAVDGIEAAQRGLPPADADLPLDLVDRLETLIREAGPSHALDLVECGRSAALNYVTAEVGALDLAWLAECARTGDQLTPSEPVLARV